MTQEILFSSSEAKDIFRVIDAINQFSISSCSRLRELALRFDVESSIDSKQSEHLLKAAMELENNLSVSLSYLVDIAIAIQKAQDVKN
jgi:hypothetical protein